VFLGLIGEESLRIAFLAIRLFLSPHSVHPNLFGSVGIVILDPVLPYPMKTNSSYLTIRKELAQL